ncbi:MULTISPECIES: hypothetical protein [Nostoc]|uniref:Uncharacterized protein n=1 Tax=Nostoc paludosum FACHB-159 TaxID=2692908 RepID=A0ABR8KEF8_9NOSO|nr:MULTISPECIES: hypothetical protein [Nostoc]MBD2680934.1 hypothetical protein [Nostoc sp. FACHB-857]MBD2737410.1 hypothetical protein [Nostoc paludosum FACHB-159]
MSFPILLIKTQVCLRRHSIGDGLRPTVGDRLQWGVAHRPFTNEPNPSPEPEG